MASRFDEILAEFGPALARVAASYARPGADQDDLLQEIAVALWQALPRFRGESSLRTFVFRIAHNRGLSAVWRRGSRKTLPAEEALDAVDPTPGPDRQVAARQEEARITAAVRKLPLAARQVITLALEGLPHAEIAGVLGFDVDLVAVRLHRARAALAKLLEERHEP